MTDLQTPEEQLAAHIEAFDHISVAVKDIGASTPFISLIGGTAIGRGHNTDGGFAWAQYILPGGGKIELISPTDPDPDNFLRRFIDSRGEGLHHLTFKVYDLADAVAAAETLGFTITGLNTSDTVWKEAFVHPASAHGVLIQLAEFPDVHD